MAKDKKKSQDKVRIQCVLAEEFADAWTQIARQYPGENDGVILRMILRNTPEFEAVRKRKV